MFWQMVACGANGIIAYTLNEKHLAVNGRTFEERWADICAVGEELRARIPVILSVEPAPEVADVPAGLCARTWRHEGKVWLLAVNTEREPRAATLRLKGAGSARVDLPPLGVDFREI